MFWWFYIWWSLIGPFAFFNLYPNIRCTSHRPRTNFNIYVPILCIDAYTWVSVYLWIFSLRIFQKQGTTIRLCDKIQFIKLFKSTLIVDVLSSETIFIFKHLETMENSQKQFINNGNLQVGISTHDRRRSFSCTN